MRGGAYLGAVGLALLRQRAALHAADPAGDVQCSRQRAGRVLLLQQARRPAGGAAQVSAPAWEPCLKSKAGWPPKQGQRGRTPTQPSGTSMQHSTAQRSRAQHSTAQQSTAQHSAAQQSTAQRSAERAWGMWSTKRIASTCTPSPPAGVMTGMSRFSSSLTMYLRRDEAATGD